MSNIITISGRYNSYEVEILEEEVAKNLIENGITEDQIDDFMFSDGNEQGLYECQIEINNEIIDRFSIYNIDLTKNNHNAASGWLLVKLESGKMTYTKQIEDNFNKNLLEFALYSDFLNSYNVDYACPMYEDEDFDVNYKSADTYDLFVISPNGEKFPIGSNEGSNVEQNKGFIDSLIVAKFTTKFSGKEAFWKQGSIGLKKEFFEYAVQAFGYFDNDGTFELAYMAIRDTKQEILYFGLPEDFGCVTDSENSFENILMKNCNINENKTDLARIANYIEGSILWQDPDAVLGNSDSEFIKIGDRVISIDNIPKENISEICLYAYRDIFPLNPATLNYNEKIGPQLGQIMGGIGGAIHNLITATILFREK